MELPTYGAAYLRSCLPMELPTYGAAYLRSCLPIELPTYGAAMDARLMVWVK